MKKFLCLIVLISLSLPCFAISPEKLSEAEIVLREMYSVIQELIEDVELAQRTQVQGVTLSVEQKQELRNSYDNKKGSLVTLYNQLP